MYTHTNPHKHTPKQSQPYTCTPHAPKNPHSTSPHLISHTSTLPRTLEPAKHKHKHDAKHTFRPDVPSVTARYTSTRQQPPRHRPARHTRAQKAESGRARAQGRIARAGPGLSPAWRARKRTASGEVQQKPCTLASRCRAKRANPPAGRRAARRRGTRARRKICAHILQGGGGGRGGASVGWRSEPTEGVCSRRRRLRVLSAKVGSQRRPWWQPLWCRCPQFEQAGGMESEEALKVRG